MTAMVEVLLATRNSGAFLRPLVDSILAQTYTDFVLTVRDDGSQDDTWEILESYHDSRVRLLSDRTPSGSAQGNFFRLLVQSKASYVMFADADDVWLPDKIERTLREMQRLENEVGKETPILVHGDLIVANEDLSVRSPSLFRYEKLSPERSGFRQLLAQNNITGCTVMVNRAACDLVPTVPQEAVMHDWWLGLIAAAFGRIGVLYEPLLYYRQHGDNAVGAYDAADPMANLKKLRDDGRIHTVYRNMFRQAGCFADTFEDKLSTEQLRLCRAYASMEHKGKIGKIACVIKNGFTKNTFVRNIGQLVKI